MSGYGATYSRWKMPTVKVDAPASQVHGVGSAKSHPARVIAASCLVAILLGPSVYADLERPGDARHSLPHRIEQLIQQLGASEYSRRRHAKLELRQLGLPALDQLLAAQLDEDPEISLAAQHLVGRLQRTDAAFQW